MRELTPLPKPEIKPKPIKEDDSNKSNEFLYSRTHYTTSVQVKVPFYNGAQPENKTEVCAGDAVLELYYPTYRINFQNVQIKCTFFKIDSVRILPWKQQPKDAQVRDNHLFVRILKASSKEFKIDDPSYTIEFDKPVPYLPPYIIQTPENLKSINETLDIKANYQKTDTDGTKTSYVDNGTMKSQVISLNGTYQTPNNGFLFDEVIHWKREVSGFKKLPLSLLIAPPMFAHKKWEWWVNARPNVVVRMRITGDSKTFITSSILTWAIDTIVGDVTIDLQLKKHEEF